MKTNFFSEQGQAIVLIALGIVGLIGMTALAIDGGNAYSDRRHAQNAADTAVIASALSKTRGNPWLNPGFTMASNNGYDNGDPNQSVILHTCDFAPGCPAPYDGSNSDFPPDEFVHIVITSNVDTFFAPVIGVEQVTNTVEAIARAKPSTEMFFGNAMVSLAQTNHPQPVSQFNGASGGSVTGGGIFANSSSDCAFDVDGGAGSISIPEGITVVGTACDIENIGLDYSSVTQGTQLPAPDYSWLDPICDGSTSYDSSTHLTNGGDTITPPANSPILFSTSHSFPPAGVEHLDPGVYCLRDPFKVLNGSLEGSNVTFVMLSDSITWNGGAIDLTAPTSGDTAGLLIYQPLTNTSTMSISGNAILDLIGTILAPGALIDLAGGTHTHIDGQIIGDSIKFTGSSGTSINYDDSQNINDPPQIEIIQ